MILLLWLVACGGPKADCMERCELDQLFFEECWDQIAETRIAFDCVDDAREMAALLAVAEDDAARNAIWTEWVDAGKVHDCASPGEIYGECRARVRGTFDALEGEEARAEGESCREPDPDNAIEWAVYTADCEAFLDYFGGG